MKAVTYHRVSTRDQNPAAARAELARAASARDLEVAEAIEETGSGARNDRPGLARVLELVHTGQVTHVLVWKLDRLGRSTLDVLATVDELERAGVTLVCTSQGLEVGAGAGAMGRMMLRVLAAVAELERELITERTRLGLAAARRRGRGPGRPPVWVDLDAARILIADGYSLREAARTVGVSPRTLRRALERGKNVPLGPDREPGALPGQLPLVGREA